MVKQKEFSDANTAYYLVYSSKSEFKRIEAGTAAEAFAKSGLADVIKIVREIDIKDSDNVDIVAESALKDKEEIELDISLDVKEKNLINEFIDQQEERKEEFIEMSFAEFGENKESG